MTKEELAMMDELASDPEYIAWVEAKWAEVMEDLDSMENREAV